MNPNMAGEDAALDSAVAAIAAKLGAPAQEKRQDTRENREDRDVIEREYDSLLRFTQYGPIEDVDPNALRMLVAVAIGDWHFNRAEAGR